MVSFFFLLIKYLDFDYKKKNYLMTSFMTLTMKQGTAKQWLVKHISYP